MADFCIYLPMETYLAQWFVHEHGGETPVRLIKGSVESKTLELFLTKRPEGAPVQRGGEGLTAIVIPRFRHRPPQTYNYLTNATRNLLLSLIRSRFDYQLWSELHHLSNFGKEQKELIYAWLEKHGIEPEGKNWDSVNKRYRRLKERYSARQRSKKNYEQRKNGSRNETQSEEKND